MYEFVQHNKKPNVGGKAGSTSRHTLALPSCLLTARQQVSAQAHNHGERMHHVANPSLSWCYLAHTPQTHAQQQALDVCKLAGDALHSSIEQQRLLNRQAVPQHILEWSIASITKQDNVTQRSSLLRPATSNLRAVGTLPWTNARLPFVYEAHSDAHTCV